MASRSKPAYVALPGKIGASRASTRPRRCGLAQGKAVLLILGCFCWAPAARAVSPDEPALAALWNLQRHSPDQHQAIAATAAEFAKNAPQSLFLPVSRGLAAWHLLQDGQRDAATALLQSMLSTAAEPIAKAGDDMAKRWLTRLDREKVKAALRRVYARTIAFPESLAVLADQPDVPATDRWGKPWQYQLTKLKHVAGVERQAFELQSAQLAPLTDLAAALALPDTGPAGLKPVRVEGQGVVTFAQNGQTMVLSEGGSVGAISFVYFGSQFLILSDGDHWLLLPRPGS